MAIQLMHLPLSLRKNLAVGAAAAVIVAVLSAQDAADWQTKAGGKMTFDVASVKLSKGDSVRASIPLGAGDAYRPSGGYFRASFPLSEYIEFAYKIWPIEVEERKMFAHVPEWATKDGYNIEARVAGNPTKDQMRLMMQSLLADRFKLAAHFETQEFSVYALTLAKPGKLGPKIISHADGRPCGDPAVSPGPVPARVIRGEAESGPENFPPMCDSGAVIKKPGGMFLLGYRNATMEMLAGSLSTIVELGRPVIDRTGLTGRFDFTIEWTPAPSGPSDSISPPAASLGTTPVQALREQLGLNVESTRAPLRILVIDSVEKPSEN